MWSALTAEFKEFVSTVSEDTSNVLSTLDAGMDKEEEGAKVGELREVDEPGLDDTADKKKMAETVDQRELTEIMTLLRDHPGTYMEPITDEDDREAVEEYLTHFSIESKTDEIAEVLKEHEDTVKKHFEELCPTQVSYPDFWTRYFYRCDEERIARQLAEETERHQEARAEAFEAGIKRVTNFFGEAVAAVTSTIAPEARDGNIIKASAGINFFGTMGRPPFVMNTAVDESGEDDEVHEEEEELGWDDEEEDLGFDQDTPRATRTTEQIEFTDKISEELKEKLKQALEERDQIQQTVHLQADEIRSLRNKLDGGNSAESENSNELTAMKLALFEKDAEIAALKALAHDESLDAVKSAECRNDGGALLAALQQEVRQLTQSLQSKETALIYANNKLAVVSQELESIRSQLPSGNQGNAQDLSSTTQELEGKLTDAHARLALLQQEILKLQLSAQRSHDDAVAQLTSLRKNLSASEQHVASLTSQLKDAHDQLQKSEAAIKQKNAELALLKKSGLPCSSDSNSNGMKVETPVLRTPVVVATRMDFKDGDANDGWGDDWSS